MIGGQMQRDMPCGRLLITSIPPVRRDSGQWARENKQYVILFAKQLVETFQPNQNDIKIIPNV